MPAIDLAACYLDQELRKTAIVPFQPLARRLILPTPHILTIPAVSRRTPNGPRTVPERHHSRQRQHQEEAEAVPVPLDQQLQEKAVYEARKAEGNSNKFEQAERAEKWPYQEEREEVGSNTWLSEFSGCTYNTNNDEDEEDEDLRL